VRAHADPAVRSLRIAEIDVDVVIAGEELGAILLPAFDGLEPAGGPPRGTVGAWDAAATGVGFTPMPPIDRDGSYQCLIRRDGRPIAELEWPNDDILRTGDRVTGTHLMAVSRASALSPWEAGAPLRRQLCWVLSPEVLFVHAAAVGGPDGAALIIGPSGAGKSSTSLACLRAGMGFLSDDYCLVRDDPPVVHRLHATARLLDEDLDHVDDFLEPVVKGEALLDADPGAKSLFLLHATRPEQMLSSAPVRVVLVPERGDGPTPRLEPMRAPEVLRAVAPSALWQLSLEPAAELRALRKLVSAVPCFRLVLSPDRRANPAAVQEALDRSRVHQSPRRAAVARPVGSA
jgi:hypothetical protein